MLINLRGDPFVGEKPGLRVDDIEVADKTGLVSIHGDLLCSPRVSTSSRLRFTLTRKNPESRELNQGQFKQSVCHATRVLKFSLGTEFADITWVL